jgi:signal transduction histidine kinase/CheY-like chemotaxis protein
VAVAGAALLWNMSAVGGPIDLQAKYPTLVVVGLAFAGSVFIAFRLDRMRVAAVAMAAAQHQAEHALRRAHDELEERVRGRTRELEQANVALQAEIADRHKAEAALLQAQKMEAVGQLTGGIAHDFNNLLTVIMGNLQILASQVADAPEAELIQAAIGAAKRGADLNRMLLVFSRKQRLAPAPVDVNEMQARIVPMLRRTLGEQIAINVVPALGLPRAMADPAQLETTLLNLAVNARDAMPEGGTLTIEMADVVFDAHTAALEGDVAPGHYVMLAVSDTGVGMTPAVAARAFEPFFTTKETGKGSGLGLAMVYGFVKQSGGHVKIYSELGVGTTAKIFLPAIDDAPSEEAKAPVVARNHPRGSETILVVEDADDVRQLACRLLTGLGYTVLQAQDSARALSVLESNPDVELLFTDVVLPGSMNGPELARVAVARYPDLKVVYTSGYTGGALRQFEAPGSRLPLINKPYSIDDLAHNVRSILDGAESI